MSPAFGAIMISGTLSSSPALSVGSDRNRTGEIPTRGSAGTSHRRSLERRGCLRSTGSPWGGFWVTESAFGAQVLQSPGFPATIGVVCSWGSREGRVYTGFSRQ